MFRVETKTLAILGNALAVYAWREAESQARREFEQALQDMRGQFDFTEVGASAVHQ